MLYRKIENKINYWVENSNSALLLTGARQVGKTTILKDILEKKNINYVYFNLIEQPEVVKLLKTLSSSNVSDISSKLSLLSNNLIKGNTIIFFDEIQEFKEIITIIKFLVLEGSFRYVLSGSLLGVELIDLRSAPVGFLETLDMYPLDFEEFLYAFNIKKEIIDRLYNAYLNRKPVDEFVHEKIMELFREYLIIGGMPEAVYSFINDHDYNKVEIIHKKIIDQYKMDFSKYESSNKLKLHRIYDLIPSELDQKNKRYIFSDIDKNFKFDRYENSFNWLIDAGLALPIFNITEPRLPIKLNVKNNLFKLFLSDVGLLTTMYGTATKLGIINKDKSLNSGAIYENVVAEELTAHGFDGYYFNSHKQGEIDFVIEFNGSVLPIEIKSGKDYEIHSALNNVLNNRDYGINEAFVLSNYNLKIDGRITYLPIYMLMFIDNDRIEKPKYKEIDLSGLTI